MLHRTLMKSPPVEWSAGVYKRPRISLFGIVIIYGFLRLLCHLLSGPNYLGILSFSFQIVLAVLTEIFLRLQQRPLFLELGSCCLAFLLQLLDVLGSMSLIEPMVCLSWLARSHMFWSLGTAGFGWRPLLAGIFLLAVLSCHTVACSMLLEDQTSFVVRDHLINFALFTVVSFGAIVQLNTLLWHMWMAESRAKMETTVLEELIAMTCDFDLLIGAVEDGNRQAETTFKVLKPSPRASGLLGRALAVGDQLDGFLCDNSAKLRKSLAEVKELQPLLLPTRLVGLAKEEMQAHLLVVRRPEGLADDCPAEALRKEQTLLATFLIAVRVDHTVDPPSEVLPQTAPQIPLTRGSSSSSNCHSVDTTVTGALFGGLELNGTGMKSLLEIGHKEHWLISPELLQLHSTKLLGSGGFGLVCEGTFCGATVALKFPRKGIKDCKFHNAESREYILFMNYLSELRLLRQVRHPNLVSFFGATVDAESLELMLVFEKMTGRTLTKFIPSENPEEDVRLQILLDIAKALVYLHSLQPAVVHGDLKGDNIYVESRKDLHLTKLGDFGLARRATKSAAGMGGTLRWCAPEVLGGSWSPSTPADSYSYGQVAFFVVSGRLPLAELKRHEMTDALTKGQLPPEDWPLGYMIGVRSLAEACRKFDPQERPSIFQIWRDLTNLQAGEATKSAGAKLIGKSATVLSASPSGSPRNSNNFRLNAHPFAAPLPAVPLLEPPQLDIFGMLGGSGGSTGAVVQTSSCRELEVQMDMARKHAFGRSPYY